MGLISDYLAKGITVAPAGVWERNAEGKKIPKIAYRKDGLKPEDYPHDNIWKYRIEEVTAPEGMRVLIIDADSAEGKAHAEKLFPQTLETFSYRTSQPYKRHYLFYVSTEDFAELRAIGVFPDIDILSYGISFTAHFWLDADYEEPDFNLPILELDIKSVEILKLEITEANTSTSTGEHIPFINKEMARLAHAYIDGKLDLKVDADRNPLFKNLTMKADKKKGQRNFKIPDPSHTALNNIALLLAKNSKLPNELVLPFLEKFVVEEWGFSLDSQLTKVHLYNSILPTLPYFEALHSNLEDFREFEDKVIEEASYGNSRWVLFATTQQGRIKYVMIDRDNYKLRSMNNSTLFDLQVIKQFYSFNTQDDVEAIPNLAIQMNPYEPLVAYDTSNDFHILNTARPTQYMINSVNKPEKPTNVLMQMIKAFFDNELHEDLYLHWLAHVTFGDKPVNIVVWLCSDAHAKAGTGKTILSSALPAHLIGFNLATTVDSTVIANAWGQVYNTKLLSYNDLNRMKSSEWDKLYAKIKDEASNSTSKTRNNKGGDIVISTQGVCQSGSSNFVPKVDSSDRRFWIVSPKKQLDSGGADEIHRIFEADRTSHHEEIQELANYLHYLHTDVRDKYRVELYTRAIMTDEKVHSAQSGAYTHSIIPRIASQPRELFEIFKEPTTVHDIWQDWQIIEFIKLQTVIDKCYLPHQFLAYLIMRVKGDNEYRNKAVVENTLEVPMKKIHARYVKYTEATDLPTEIRGYSGQGAVFDVEPLAYSNFMPKKLEAKGILKLTQGKEDEG